ncbi:MAG: hypothetical protein M1819_001527 [Sarea resinae]|nr:MAG: hypothetical protein M1819_001527 [Sarea resinae]
MSSSAILAELDTALQAMQSLKPPGVSGSRIASITALCDANVQSESVIIQKLYTHFKKTPGTHKLGVLYVVDSVTRQWVNQARKAGQLSGSAPSDGTYAAGVNRVTELLPVLMTDIIQSAPEDQKEKVKKLVDIWERGNTFPAQMLSSFKEKLNAPAHIVQSTTPVGTPPRDIQQSLGQQQPNANAPNTTAILAALANMAKQSTSTPPAAGFPPRNNSNNMPSTHSAVPQSISSSVNPAPLPPTAQPVNMPAAGANLLSQFPGLNMAAQSTPNTQANPLAALSAFLPPTNPAGGQDALQQQLMLLQGLAQAGVPQDQWVPLIAALNAGAAAPAATNGNPAMSWPQVGDQQNAWGGRHDHESRDRNGFNESEMRSPRDRFERRSRSPPNWSRGRESPPVRRRDSPVYGEYNGDSGDGANRDGNDRRSKTKTGRGRGNDYRQRSPIPSRRHRSMSPADDAGAGAGPKWIEYDYSIGHGNIKVLSRTLFVGGVTTTERELRSIFSQFGRVQTCIVNTDKRHAFVKMITRREALTAREGMEHFKSAEMQLRTRWGVGFGPRDCSDYQTGISIIPIDRLTDADRKWMLTAEYGGSGGKPIESGMCVEEPDIEIGAGVSSKAISRRMATDQGGKTGPRSSRGGQEGSRFRRSERNEGDRDANTIGVPPAVPGFGFQFPGMPAGMPMLPPGFIIPGSTPAQPPPPGHSG